MAGFGVGGPGASSLESPKITMYSEVSIQQSPTLSLSSASDKTPTTASATLSGGAPEKSPIVPTTTPPVEFKGSVTPPPETAIPEMTPQMSTLVVVVTNSNGGSSTTSTEDFRGNQSPSAKIIASSGGPVPTFSVIGKEGGGNDQSGFQNKPGSHNETSSRGAIVGGILGGVALILLGYAFFVLYSRYKGGRDGGASGHIRVQSDEEAGPTTPTLRTPSIFHRRPAYDTDVHPLIHNSNYRPPEGKRERLERVQREMEETQRKFNLEMRRNRSINSGREVERLRQRIEQMKERIRELELERREDLPPDYHASIVVDDHLFQGLRE